MKDRVVVPRQKYKPKKSEHKKAGKNQDPINEPPFRRQMHEHGGNSSRLQCRHQHGDADVGFARSEIDVGKSDGYGGKREQERTYHQITANVFLYTVRVFLVLFRILRNIGRIVHGLEQIKQREYENPDQIDKVPKQAAHFDAISQMFRIALIKFFAHR